MRTTLTLDDDAAHLVDDATHREQRSTQEVINDALHRALTTRSPQPYRVDVQESAIRPGIDISRLNQLADPCHELPVRDTL